MSLLRFPLADVGAVITDRLPYDEIKIKSGLSGKEFRSTWVLAPRTRYSIKQSCLRDTVKFELQRWLSMWQRHRGSLDSFLLDDPADNAAADPSIASGGQCFGLGDGATTTFQLQRRTLGSHYDNLPGGPWRVSSGPRTNLLLQSQTFSAGAWSYGTGATGTLNACIAPDNGGATVLAYDGSGSAGAVRISTNPAAASAIYCGSVWLRADSPTTVRIGTGTTPLTTCNLTTAWQRFSFVTTSAADFGIFSPAAVNASFRIYAWGAQSEADPASTGIPTALIPTTSAAVTVNPSFWPLFGDGYLPVYDLNGPTSIYRQDYQGTVQLFPWTRTNLLLQSQAFGNATWTKVTMTAGAAVTAPDGTTTAIPLTATAGSAGVLQNVAGITVGQQYIASVWLKCAAGTTAQLSVTGGAQAITITSAWQRFVLPFTATTTSTNFIIGSIPNAAVVQMWGAQFEVGQTVTSYIPTTTTTVTAASDYTLPGSGTITFAAAPLGNAVLSWKGSYFIRCRLDQQDFPTARVVNGVWSVNLSLVSIKP